MTGKKSGKLSNLGDTCVQWNQFYVMDGSTSTTSFHQTTYKPSNNHGSLYYDTSAQNWNIWIDHSDNTADDHSDYYWGGWITIPSISPDITITPTVEPPGVPFWLPVKCECCDKDIMSRDDGLSIVIGDKTLWFHRRCFASKENQGLIRSIIVVEDLDLV